MGDGTSAMFVVEEGHAVAKEVLVTVPVIELSDRNEAMVLKFLTSTQMEVTLLVTMTVSICRKSVARANVEEKRKQEKGQ